MGIGFPSALFLVFLTLKLTETIDWSWWWITCPLWADFILSVWAGVVNTRKKEALKKAEEEYKKTHPGKKSKFMELLEQRMKESEEARKKARMN
jgi:hypothetical protein